MTLLRFRVLLRRTSIVILLAVVAGSLNLAVAVAQDDRPGQDPELVARGQQLYDRACVLCHGDNATGLDRPGEAGGPALVGVGSASVDFMLRTGRMPASDQRDRLRRRPPAYDETDIAALVAYITSLAPDDQSGPAIPVVDRYETADLASGREAFTTNCAACHGATAAGVAVGQTDVSSNLDVASPLEIAEAVRTGPGVMPRFGPDVLTDEDLDAVVKWVVNLRARESPGGLSVGRSGPVSEGFIAWLVGLGFLGVVMYLLGEKAGDKEPADE